MDESPEGEKGKPAVNDSGFNTEIAMKVAFISLISNDIIAHEFLLDVPERWILAGIVLLVIRVTRR